MEGSNECIPLPPIQGSAKGQQHGAWGGAGAGDAKINSTSENTRTWSWVLQNMGHMIEKKKKEKNKNSL